jgi:hypothetical protein
MTETIRRGDAPITASEATYLVRVAARAPSLNNSQPWRFRVGERAVELYADPRRQLPEDPDGREMLISCGAALYGLRLALRSLGCVPEVDLLPEPDPATPAAGRRPLARVRLGAPAPITPEEHRLLAATPHRHTHRGPFEAGPLPDGLFPSLQLDAEAEGATLTALDSEQQCRDLAAIAALASLRDIMDPAARAQTARWTRELGSPARDGVPAHAFPPTPAEPVGWLPPRDFDLGRGLGRLPAGWPTAYMTAVLTTAGDGEPEWLRAGQALHRLLLRAASQWVFAGLQTQPLRVVWTRILIRRRLDLPGWPQMIMQLGLARSTHSTARRPPADLIDP